MGIYPDPFWRIDWREFDYFVQAKVRKDNSAWQHTREMIAAIYNQTAAITSQQAGKRNYRTISGQDIIKLPGDIQRKTDLTPGSTEALEAFRDACKRLGVPIKAQA